MSDNFRINFYVPDGSSFEEMPDGSLIVHNVPAMCEGMWTSMEGKTVLFSPQDLKANCANWTDNGIWTRHPLMPGENRPSDICVGGVLNPRFVPNFSTVLEDGTLFTGAAVLCDLVFNRQTDGSKDAAIQIRLPKEAGGFRMTSAEIIMQASQFDAANNVYRPSQYAFGGLTIQRKGGCKACNIPAFASAAPGQEIGNMADTPPAVAPPVNQAPPTPGGTEAIPAWATELVGICKQILEREMQEAAEKGAAKGAKPKEPSPPAPAANECSGKAGMAAPGPDTVAFAAEQLKVKDLEEKNRVLKAELDKALSKPALSSFVERSGPAMNTEGKPSLNAVLVGKNMHWNRG